MFWSRNEGFSSEQSRNPLGVSSPVLGEGQGRTPAEKGGAEAGKWEQREKGSFLTS